MLVAYNGDRVVVALCSDTQRESVVAEGHGHDPSEAFAANQEQPAGAREPGSSSFRAPWKHENRKQSPCLRVHSTLSNLMPFTYDHPRPALTVDCVVFGFDGSVGLQILLIRRGIEPFRGTWALPGGFVHMDEDLEGAARRELQEETGLRDVYLEQLYTFGEPGRDPRGRVVSVAYFALVRPDRHPAKGDTDASDAAWHPLDDLPALAFDHPRIIDTARERLRGKVRYQPVGFELLPARFTLGQLQALYEAVLGRPVDKRNFRKKVLAFNFLVPLEAFAGGAHRPARLYRFDRRKYDALVRRGFNFEL